MKVSKRHAESKIPSHHSRRTAQQHHSRRRPSPKHRRLRSPSRPSRHQRQRLANRKLRNLWHHSRSPLHRLHSLSRHPDPERKTHLQNPRSFRNLSTNRRHLHSIPAGKPARPLGLDAPRNRMDASRSRNRLQILVRRSRTNSFDVRVSRNGLARADSHQAANRRSTAQRPSLAVSRRRPLQLRRSLLRLKKNPLRPHHLARLRNRRKHLPLRSSPTLRNQVGEGLSFQTLSLFGPLAVAVVGAGLGVKSRPVWPWLFVCRDRPRRDPKPQSEPKSQIQIGRETNPGP